MIELISISNHKLKYHLDSKIDETKSCPLSGDKGLRILTKTLANHVYPAFWDVINTGTYYFCDNRECPVVYFNNIQEIYFGIEDLHSSVMHKMELNSEYRPACYCKNVTEKKILDELIDKKCCDTLIDIQEYTGANTGKSCVITNPTGRCCGKQIKEIIEFAKKSNSQISVPLIEEAEACCVRIVENAMED